MIVSKEPRKGKINNANRNYYTADFTMNGATIFALIGHLLLLVWTIMSEILREYAGVDYQIISIIWMFVALFSSVTLLVFLITFMNVFGKLEKELDDA